MNKLITKIMASLAGFAMAIGVGVGISRGATELNAMNDIQISFPGNPSQYTNSYSKSFTITSGGISFSFANWNNGQQANAWTEIRGGSKNNAWTGTITSGQIASKVQSVVVSVSSTTTNGGGASTLEVATNATFTENLQTVNKSADSTTGNKTYTISSPTENCYYRLTHNAAKGSANGEFRINGITFNYVPSKTLSNIALSGTYPTSFEQGDAFSHEGMTVTATYSDASTADVTSSATFTGYDMSTAGDQTVTVSYTENEITKTATYDISVTAATLYTVGGTIANGSLSSTNSVKAGNALNINIVPNEKYSLPATLGTVTMGGNVLTIDNDYTYNSDTGEFNIASVTGNVVINAECTKTHGLWSDDPYTVSEAWNIIDGLNSAGANTDYIAYVSGTISSDPTINNYNGADFDITDGVKDLTVYSVSGAKITRETGEGVYIENGYSVIVSGSLIRYVKNNTTKYEVGFKSAQLPGNLVSADAPTYTVTYNSNGATSGNVPVDNAQHSKYTSATVLGNTGSLAKTNYEFNGWNTNADPTADGAQHYDVGAEFEVLGNVTLYAEWLSTAPSITVQSNLSGFTGEEIDLDFTYGYIADPSTISVVAADNKVTVGDLIAENNGGIVTIIFNTVGNTSLSFQNGGVELATCAVTVNQSTVTITGLPSTAEAYVGKTLDLGSKISVEKTGSYNTSVTWTSSNTDVAEVSSSGVVTGKATGEAVVMVKSISDPTVSQSCTVSVNREPLSFTWDLSVDSTESASDDSLVWADRRASMIADKADSTTKANNYYPGTPNQSYTSTRFYKNSTLTIAPVDGYVVRRVEFTATTANYASALANSDWTNASASVANNTTVVVTPVDGTADIVATIGATSGVSSVEISYTDPIAYIDSLASIATIHGEETEPGVVTSVALRFGTEISKNAWKALDEEYGIDSYGVMLFRTTEERLGSVLSVKEYFELGEENVTISRKDGSNAPSSEGENYDFSVQINISSTSKFNRYYCAAPFFVVDGQYHFLEEMRFSVNELASYYLTHPGSDLSTEALTYLATTH